MEKTHEYFDRLGIKDFVNLVTATDNYVPKNYPDCKAGKIASEFIPTWMLAMEAPQAVMKGIKEQPWSMLLYWI